MPVKRGMAVTNITPTISYTKDGTAGTAHPIPFKLLQASDLEMYVDGVLSEDGFTVGGTLPDEATVVTTDDYTSGTKVTFKRNVTYEQQTTFSEGERYPGKRIENEFDNLAMQIQQLDEVGQRAIKTNPGETPPGGTVTKAINTSLGQDSDGNLVSRTVAEEVSFLGIGDSVTAAAASASAAQVSALSAEEQAGFANDERVLAETAADEAQAAQSLSSATLLDLSTKTFPKVRIGAEVLGTISSDVTLTFPGGGSITLKTSARPYAEDNGINAEGNPDAVDFLSEIKSIINGNAIDFDSSTEYGLEPTTTVSNYTAIPDWSAEFPIIDGVINTSKLDLTYYGGDSLTFTVPSPFTVIDGADLDPPAKLPFVVKTEAEVAINPPASYVNALVIGQSNVNSGRARSTTPYAEPKNDSVFIWDRHREELAVWDPDVITPTQHRDETTDADPNPYRNIWARVLPGQLSDLIGKPFKVVSSTRSGVGLESWVENVNGGTDDSTGLWTRIVDGAAAVGIKKFDFVFFDHGESSASGLSYPEALTEFYGQLVDGGYVDSETIFIFREILSPSQNNASIANQFVTIHGNGYAVSNSGLTYSDGVHIDGESHDEVASRALTWYKSEKFVSSVEDSQTLQIPTSGFIRIDGTSTKIPVAEFAGFLGDSKYPDSPDVLAYGDNYSEGTEILTPVTGPAYTRGGTGADPFLDSYNLELPATNSYLESATRDIPTTTDWVIGMRVKVLNGATRNFLLSQYDGGAGRWFIERDASDKLRFFFDGNQILSVGTYTDADEFVTLTVRRASDDFYLKVNDEAEQTLNVASVTLRDLPTIIGAVTGQGQCDAQFQKFIIYQRLLDAGELTSLRAWLSLV